MSSATTTVLRRGQSAFRWTVTLALMAAVALTVSPITLTAAKATAAPADAGEFAALTPTRVIDTSAGTGGIGPAGTLLQPGQTFNYNFLNGAGVPNSGVLAVVLHVTTNGGSSSSSSDGYLWVYPTGPSPNTHPTSDTLSNSSQGYNSDNTAIVQLGTGAQAGLVSFYEGSQASAVGLKVDVEGYITSSSNSTASATFAPLTLTRVVDTKLGVGGRAMPLTSSSNWDIPVADFTSAGVPTTGVAALALNLGAFDLSANHYLAATPTGQTITSAASKVHGYSGGVAQQLVVVGEGTGGAITLSTDATSVDASVDVEGYYLTAGAGGSGEVYVPIAPQRIVDTRSDLGISTPLGPAATTVSGVNAVPDMGIGGVPSEDDLNNVAAVALNITTMNGGANGFVTVWPEGASMPPGPASSVSVDGGTSSTPTTQESNLAFVPVGDSGELDFYSSAGVTPDVLVDLEGYFETLSPPSPPNGFSATPVGSSGSFTATWTPPDTNGGLPLTGYTLTGENSDGSPAGYQVTVGASINTYTFTGLPPNSTAYVSVVANNSLGSSDPNTNLPDTTSNNSASSPQVLSITLNTGQTLTDAQMQSDGYISGSQDGARAAQQTYLAGESMAAFDGGQAPAYHEPPAPFYLKCSHGTYGMDEPTDPANATLQYTCHYFHNVQFGIKLKPPIIALCVSGGGLASETGMSWFKNGIKGSKTAAHPDEFCDYHFHGTFHSIHDTDVVGYSDTLSFEATTPQGLANVTDTWSGGFTASDA